ncbi:Ribosomal protein L32p [Melia azedarach]|uniref:Ribosomal protein L32p n=1 Tax=Melia azedarach TaxID=155640 RepID=A0ACC1XM29_MELAZ|nr:Ribosomal protein L32p [Melia azedarach]
MALRLAVLKSAGGSTGWTSPFRRWAHVSALPPPLDATISSPVPSPPFVLPESDQSPDKTNNVEFGFPSFSIGGSMELMAVPKRKVSPHKRGIRNGPKALKPVPVIIRCKSCGRVKLPHFFCCSGERRKE